MRIAVLSGKGGTGKTFVSVNLACAAEHAVYADCDIEEPDGQLFFKPQQMTSIPVTVPVPEFSAGSCSGCHKCTDLCAWHALACVKNKIIVFEEMCHSCGGCILVCPEKALRERDKNIGTIDEGVSDSVRFFSGCLNTGEVSGVPVIKTLIKKLPEAGTVIIDCPPGSACSVMESIRSASFCVLVAEPTVFGVQNLETVYELVTLFGKKCGVVINKNINGRNPAESFCKKHHIPVLVRIPFEASLGRLNSEGEIAVRENDTYRDLFRKLLTQIQQEAQK
jgi:MinD superfamily P-loop ATPase